jgi:hypothetical protein
MLLTRQFFDSTNTSSPHITNIDSSWCNNSSNKHSSSKWKKLVIDLFNSGYSIRIRTKDTTSSKYLWVAGKEKAIKVRVSNHLPTIPKELRKHSYWNKKFGNTGLIVGVGGVSTKDAYHLIKETI